MSNQKQSVLTAALVGAMSPEGEVSQPQRARSASFTSTVCDLKVGDNPAARVQMIDPKLTLDEVATHMGGIIERFRNGVQSSVTQARRRVPDRDYSVEVVEVKAKSGLYLVALVHRTA